jgi:hypothetical protein
MDRTRHAPTLTHMTHRVTVHNIAPAHSETASQKPIARIASPYTNTMLPSLVDNVGQYSVYLS